MIEKLIENWLDRSSERSWQRPFCAMLAAHGHNVVHSTRHSELELGVDVISVNPENQVCAFQLKSARGERLTLNEWREISSQIDDMVCRQLKHPAIPEKCRHRSFLVVDAWLEESVSRDIDDRNEQWRNQGQTYRKIEVILRSDLLSWALDLGGSLWPSELADSQLLLEIFLTNGDGQLPIEKLCKLIEATCPICDDCRKPTLKSVQRSAAATVLLTGIAISSFSENDNHGAEIEAWTICLASLLACCDRWHLKRTDLCSEIELAEQFVFDSLSRLAFEVRERKTLLEGEAIFDAPFDLLRVRTTFVAATLSVLGIWRRQSHEESDDLDDFLRKFVLSKSEDLLLWGEAAVPQFLAVFFFIEQNDGSCRSDSLICSLASALVESNKPGAATPLPSPYYGVSAVMPHHWTLADKSIDDSFEGGSYCLEGVLHLVARRGWKQFLAQLWYDVSAIARYEFVVEKRWHFYRWRNPGHGTNVTTIPPCPQRWDDLLASAKECDGRCLPRHIKQNPAFVLLFLCVMPHRFNSGVARWLDRVIE